jgi:hypothetical protein
MLRRRLLQFFAIMASLLTVFYIIAPFRRSPTASIDNAIDSAPATNIDGLSEFLQSRGIGTDRTLFVTIASEPYIEPMVNFRMGLDRFSLGGDYVVLCLDVPCLDTARKYDIVAFEGYLMKETEAGDDGHDPVAQTKVHSSFPSLTSSLPQTLNSLKGDTTLSSSTVTSTSPGHVTPCPRCFLSQTQHGTFNYKTTATESDGTGLVRLPLSTTSSFGLNGYGMKRISRTKRL